VRLPVVPSAFTAKNGASLRQGLSDAGRKLFDRSRTQRTVVNDADRLRKYLQKYGLSWEAVSA
jgi:sigma54-dependent transcription regulator